MGASGYLAVLYQNTAVFFKMHVSHFEIKQVQHYIALCLEL